MRLFNKPSDWRASVSPLSSVECDEAASTVALTDVSSYGGGAQVDGVGDPGRGAGSAGDIIKELPALRLLLKPWHQL